MITPLILVDGPKSELRAQIARDLAERYVTMHCIGHINTTPDTYVRMMTPAIDRVRPVVIECSWVTQEQHIGLLSNITRGVFQNHFSMRRMLDRLALGCGAISIIAMDRTSELAAMWTDPNTVLETRYAMEWGDALAKNLHECLVALRNPGPGIGHWAKNQVVLLVGDQHGDTTQPYNVQRNIAFCSMSGAGCSEWLTKQLHDAGFSERDFYWINAREPKAYSGKATPWDFVEQLAPIATIALGSMAERWCALAGIPYRLIPHPQFWKRFHSKSQYPLIPLLQEIYGHRQCA